MKQRRVECLRALLDREDAVLRCFFVRRDADHQQSGQRYAKRSVRTVEIESGLLRWTVFNNGLFHTVLPHEQRVSAQNPGVEGDFRRQRQSDLSRIDRVFRRLLAVGLA